MDEVRRPRATPRRLLPWLGELGRSAVGVVDAWLPTGRGISPRARERVVLVVTEVNGCRYTEWIHGAWLTFLGDDEQDDTLAALVEHARASAVAGAPASIDEIEPLLTPEALRSVRATIALAELSTLAGNSVDAAVGRVRGLRPLDPVATVNDAVVAAVTIPVSVPLVALSAAMRAVNRVSPALPLVEAPRADEANLVVHLLVEAVPALLRNALVRTAVLALPRPLVIGVRTEGQTATVRLSRQRLVLENGLADDAAFVVEGGVDLLLEAAGRVLHRELRELSGRRST